MSLLVANETRPSAVADDIITRAYSSPCGQQHAVALFYVSLRLGRDYRVVWPLNTHTSKERRRLPIDSVQFRASFLF